MKGEKSVGEHDVYERLATLENDNRWLRREVETIKGSLEEIKDILRRSNGHLSWRAVAQLSTAISGLVVLVTYLVQRLG